MEHEARVLEAFDHAFIEEQDLTGLVEHRRYARGGDDRLACQGRRLTSRAGKATAYHCRARCRALQETPASELRIAVHDILLIGSGRSQRRIAEFKDDLQRVEYSRPLGKLN